MRLQVGVYGYAAYSASKFALRGLAECLQQELIDRNIRLSLVYPPDTMTPGYVEGAFLVLFHIVWMHDLASNSIFGFEVNFLTLADRLGRRSYLYYLRTPHMF